MSSAANVVLFAVACASAGYLVLANLRVAAFARRPKELATEFLPSITVLKPIAGAEPGLYENLRSCCDQDYDAPYEVVFALHDRGDPALAVAERLANEFADRSRVAIGNNPAMRNPKIANLAKTSVRARNEIVVISDSDIHTGRGYLRAIAASFASERVGAATCLYAGIPNSSAISRLGAMQIEEVFVPSVLVALALGPLRFCLGATMAVRRSILEVIGGLESLGAGIADDHKLGELVAKRGKRIELSRYVVGTTVAERSLRDLWSHELRWARTNFALAPAGYAFSFLMYALPLAVLYLGVSRNLAWGLPLLAIVALLRVTLHYLARAALEIDRRDDLLFILPRDLLSLVVWFASFFGRRVRWRERTYTASSG